jgi:hypothetical protein
LEYADLDPQDAAANREADRLGDIEHAYHISEAGQREQLELAEQAHLDYKADVKYWNNIEMEEAVTAWAKGTRGDQPSDPIIISDTQDSTGTKITWPTSTANSASRPTPARQINTLPVVCKEGVSYAAQAAKKARPVPPPNPAPSTGQAFNGQALTEAQLTDPRTTKPVIINSAQVIFGTKLGMGRTKAQLIERYRQLIRDKGMPNTTATTVPAQP